jgi:uncharacterized protein (TIRG00374 family)
MNWLRRVFANGAVRNGLKIGLAVVLLAIVFRKVDWHDMFSRLRGINWYYLLGALALQWVVVLIGNHRLKILLKALDIHLTYWRTFRYTCIGYFFNLAFPGGMGGDVVKMFYVARETHNKAAAVTAILLDRFLGLLAVVMIATVALIGTVKSSPAFQPLLPIVIVMLALSFAGGLVLLTKNHWEKYAWWRVIERYIPKFILGMINAMYTYRSHKRIAILAMGESLVLQLLMCVFGWLCGEALHFDIHWYTYFVMFPILTLVLTLPITPGGLGLTEYFANIWFEKAGESAGAGLAFMLLLRLNMLIMALSGFIYWILPGVHVSREELARGTEEIVEEERALEHLDDSSH